MGPIWDRFGGDRWVPWDPLQCNPQLINSSLSPTGWPRSSHCHYARSPAGIAALAASSHGVFLNETSSPIEEPEQENPSNLDRPIDSGLSAKSVAVLALGVGLLGYLFGRASAPAPPDPARVRSDVDAVFKDRIDEATRHGVNGAVPLLVQAQNDVLAALRKQGVIA